MKKNTRKLIRLPRSRKGFMARPMRQVGSYIVLNAGVSKKVAKLVRTEAAINNKSMSAMLASILEDRYSKVK